MIKPMMMLLFLLLPLLALAYVCWHVWLLLPLSWGWKALIILLMVSAFAMLFASIFRATDRLPMPVATAIYEVGTSSIIVLLYLTMLFVVLDIARLVHLLPAAWLRDNWWTAGCIVLFLFGLFVYGNPHYRHKYREEVTLRSTKVTKPVKLVLMSDLHLGYHNRRKEFARWVDLINNEQPDMILVAGDIIDGSHFATSGCTRSSVGSKRPSLPAWAITNTSAASLRHKGSTEMPIFACCRTRRRNWATSASWGATTA